jgi:hypothetical protein
MVEISMFGSGEGLVWATGRGYSTGIIELGIIQQDVVGAGGGHQFLDLISVDIGEMQVL